MTEASFSSAPTCGHTVVSQVAGINHATKANPNNNLTNFNPNPQPFYIAWVVKALCMQVSSPPATMQAAAAAAAKTPCECPLLATASIQCHGVLYNTPHAAQQPQRRDLWQTAWLQTTMTLASSSHMGKSNAHTGQ
jgi:hypothetical protein